MKPTNENEAQSTEGVAASSPRPALVRAYNQALEDAKDAIRATGSDKWEGSEFKPYFINEIARKCDPRRVYDFETMGEARTYLSSVITDIATVEGQRELEQLYQEARIRERDDDYYVLYDAIKKYAEQRNGSVDVIEGVQVQEWPEDGSGKYRIAIKCIGQLPVLQSREQTPKEQQ